MSEPSPGTVALTKVFVFSVSLNSRIYSCIYLSSKRPCGKRITISSWSNVSDVPELTEIVTSTISLAAM